MTKKPHTTDQLTNLYVYATPKHNNNDNEGEFV